MFLLVRSIANDMGEVMKLPAMRMVPLPLHHYHTTLLLAVGGIYVLIMWNDQPELHVQLVASGIPYTLTYLRCHSRYSNACYLLQEC